MYRCCKSFERSGRKTKKLTGNHYTAESARNVDVFLDAYHELKSFTGKKGANTLRNTAVVFGSYIGETLLRCGLTEKGFVWVDNGNKPPFLRGPSGKILTPIEKVQKRVLSSSEKNMESFVNMTLMIINGER